MTQKNAAKIDPEAKKLVRAKQTLHARRAARERPVAMPALDNKGNISFAMVGSPEHYLSDFYYFLMVARWPVFFGMVASAYVTLNVLFASLFLAGGDCIANARPGSFTDAFFFSVQTMATIGYGGMAPSTLYAHALVTIEALLGLLGVSMATGLMFAKFSRPRARVIFSKVALLSRRNGQPHLTFRVANARANQIVEATIKVVALRVETTAEGETLRRFHEIALVRSTNPLFALSWTVMHHIDEKSPLHGLTLAQIREQEITLLAIFVGMDATFGQTIHERQLYTADDLIPDARFVDMNTEHPGGKRVVNIGLIHDHTPIDAAG